MKKPMTICTKCQHVSIRPGPGWTRFKCLASVISGGINPVTGEQCEPEYAQCVNRNKGDCKLFEGA